MTVRPMRVDPLLPPISSADLVCPGCGQSYADILERDWRLPERHYTEPIATSTKGKLGQPSARTNESHIGGGWVCSLDADQLTALIFVAQRARAS